MRVTMLLSLILCLGSVVGLSETWTGVLVDSKCYDSEQSNVNPFAASPYVASDRDLDIRLCHPRAHKTKFFAVVLQDGESFRLDPVGNAKAADLVTSAGKRPHYIDVAVTGEMSQGTVKVDSISTVK